MTAPVLIGLRGTGKTTVAHALSRRLGLSYCDADRALEEELGLTIPQIFAQHGEAWFRERECALLVRLLEQSTTILATGGGAVLHPPVRTLLKQRVTVWLRAPVALLAQRIAGSDRPRLLAEAADMAAELQQILAVREPLYAEVARHVVGTEQLTVDQVVEVIARYCNTRAVVGPETSG